MEQQRPNNGYQPGGQQPGGQPGYQPGYPKPDGQSGQRFGYQPGQQPGQQPGGRSGYQPGNPQPGNPQAGQQSGQRFGYQPGQQPGYQPGNQPGNQPGGQQSGQRFGGQTGNPQPGWQQSPPPAGGRQHFLSPEKWRDHTAIRHISNATGIAIIVYTVLPALVSVILNLLPGFTEAYNSNQLFALAVDSLFAMECVGLPFFVSYVYLRREELSEPLAFGTPASGGAAALLVFIGLMLCMVGNYATGFLSNFVNAVFGITFTAPEDAFTITNGAEFGMRVLQTAVVPALVEEFAMRGTVLMPLRRYGDKFALLTSAFVFALIHGNMEQIPFAFIAGLGLGYAVLATGSLWTGVLIHFFNNFIAVCSEAMYDLLPASTASVLTLAMLLFVFLAGVVALIIYLVRYQRLPLDTVKTPLDSRERNRAFLCSAPMVISIVLLVLRTITYVEI